LDLTSFLRKLPRFLKTSILIDLRISRWNFCKTFQSLMYTLLRLSWLKLTLITNSNPTFRA
jgi:hypothetical protein